MIKEQWAFARKFPQRTYRPREPISVSCSDRFCTVHGLVDFRSVDPVAKIISEGVATFEYQLNFAGGTIKINLENGEISSRNRTPLAPSSGRTLSLPYQQLQGGKTPGEFNTASSRKALQATDGVAGGCVLCWLRASSFSVGLSTCERLPAMADGFDDLVLGQAPPCDRWAHRRSHRPAVVGHFGHLRKMLASFAAQLLSCGAGGALRQLAWLQP